MQKEIFNELADKGLKEITELDKKVNYDDLVYKYKGKRPDEKFDKYDNALDLINKIKNGEIKLSEAKNNQIVFKSHRGEIKKGSNKKKSKEQKNTLYDIEMQETRQLNFMMIILQWYLRQKIKELKEQDLK